MRIFEVVIENKDDVEKKEEERYTRIRVESIEYQQQPATAVYFEEMTKNV